MNKCWLIVFGFFFAVLSVRGATPQHTFGLENGKFRLDQHPFQILAGEMHYPRIPRARWRYAMRLARAMGLNTVTTYVFWNLHEPEPGRYNFTGQNDLAAFLRIAQEEGLYVVLRPGPYVCAEWEFGWYPAWLIKDRTTEVRSLDPKFMKPAADWFQHLGTVVQPFLLANGGPVIAVQVENEYGSFGKDTKYMQAIRQIVMDSGMGGTKEHPTLLFTVDGGEQQPNGSLPDLPAAVSFGLGAGGPETSRLHAFRPDGPLWVGEYWAGWFDHWGRNHAQINTDKQVAEYELLLRQGFSINLYMLWGGTSFGWMNGANIDAGKYGPDVTSYDYDVPVSENGELRRKYFLLRDVIQKQTGISPPAPPAPMPAKALAQIEFKASTPIWDSLPRPVASQQILSMEDLGQNYGYILYRTNIAHAQSGELRINELHSYAQIYLDGIFAGALDRRLDQSSLSVQIQHDNTRLDILVENSGRVNFGHQFSHERAGITREVTLANQPLINWQIYPLPMDNVNSLDYKARLCTGACFYHATFKVDQPADTFIDGRSLGKGEVFVNGRALGRFWNIGPQRTLYLPGPWLKPGENEIVIFDMNGKPEPTVPMISNAILDERSK